MNYKLNKSAAPSEKSVGWKAMKGLLPLVLREKRDLGVALLAIILNTGATLLAPIIIGHAVDHAIKDHDFGGVLEAAAVLIVTYAVALIASYTQTIRMGTVGRHVLYHLRNEMFVKLESLPVAFFNQNKVGDLISRINNDTDRLNQFFAQGLMHFVSNFFVMVGAGIFLVSLQVKLGAAALIPALLAIVLARVISPYVKRANMRSLQSTGGMSAEIQESLNNFKMIIAFNRLDYIREKFSGVNEKNFAAALRAGFANNIYLPTYTLAAHLGQLVVFAYGVVLIGSGHMTLGLLVSFLLYVNSFYEPLRQIGSVWAMFEQAFAALDRVSEILSLTSDMPIIPALETTSGKSGERVLEFRNVAFAYPEGKAVVRHVNLNLEAGKTYALVGPTGGGKTTTASLMARLYDATEGEIRLLGRDIRSYTAEERARRIGFILQEPFLFEGTVLENICYGHPELQNATSEVREKALDASGLLPLLASFGEKLDIPVKVGGDGMSVGQRQLIAFVRAVLRKPQLLILDEATANIDTVTERLLEEALQKLPASTTKVIIAHRLNTIERADEIYFVNGGEVRAAGSFDHAVELLMHGKRAS